MYYTNENKHTQKQIMKMACYIYSGTNIELDEKLLDKTLDKKQ